MKKRLKKQKYPIKHWSHSSLLAFLRNPLAWYKRYVENVRDMPSGPASFIGRAGHVALQHFYSGMSKEASVELGLEYLRSVDNFEIDFGKAKSKSAQKKKRQDMEKEYLQAIGFYLRRPPKYDVVGVEVMGTAEIPGLPLPVKAISDLVVKSKDDPKALDIVDHKFVSFFTPFGEDKPLFILQAIFNYYVVTQAFEKPVRRFIFQECKRRKNKDGSSQMRRHVIEFKDYEQEFVVFQRLLRDATLEIGYRQSYLPNPSDMFEGKNSYDIYRMGLTDE